MPHDYDTEDKVRDFLALCLEPRPGSPRTPEALAEIVPGPLRDGLHSYAPNLAELYAARQQAAREAAQATKRYADAMAAWITGDHSAHERDHTDGVPWPQCLTCSTESHTVDWTVTDPATESGEQR